MDESKTVYCGNLADAVTEELLYELFLQVAPLERVKIPTDREGRKSSYGFVTFKHEVSVNYAVKLLNGIKLFQKGLTIKPRNGAVNYNRSQSYPMAIPNNYHNPRLNDSSETTTLNHSYDDLIQLGQMMNVNQSYSQDSFENNYKHNQSDDNIQRCNDGNNHNPQRKHWQKNNYKDNRNYNRRNDYSRDRDLRHDNNRRNNNRKYHDKRHYTDNKPYGRRNNRDY